MHEGRCRWSGRGRTACELCGATTSSQAHEPSAGVWPNIPLESASSSSTRRPERPRAARRATGGVVSHREPVAATARRQAGTASQAWTRPPRRSSAAQRHADQQVGQPRHGRVVAGEQQLARAAGRGRRAGRRPGWRSRAVGQLRPDHAGDSTGAEHHPAPPRATARAPGAQTEERQPQQEQHAVVGEDDREAGLELAQHQSEQRRSAARAPPGRAERAAFAGRAPARGRPVISARVTPASTANSADARPPASHWPRSGSPSGSRSASTWVATMPSSARQRATSRPTSAPGAGAGAVRSRAARRAASLADRLALLLRPAAQVGLEVDHPLPQAGSARRGSGRRAARRCGRCPPRRWRPARRPASARSRAASPGRRGS